MCVCSLFSVCFSFVFMTETKNSHLSYQTCLQKLLKTDLQLLKMNHRTQDMKG